MKMDMINCELSILQGNAGKLATVKYFDIEENSKWPDLEDFVSTESAMLIRNNLESPGGIGIKKTPKYFIEAISIVTECRKIELFAGEHLLQYVRTLYGDMIDDFDGTTVYRHDILMDTNQSSQVSLKFIQTGEFWVYGMYISLKLHNSNVEQTAVEQQINFKDVDNILLTNSLKLTPNAEKCKSFIESYMTSTQKSKSPPNMQMLMSMFNSNLALKQLTYDEHIETKENEHVSSPDKPTENSNDLCSIKDLKKYFDFKLAELESRINDRINQLETSQNQKLDKIIGLLEKSANFNSLISS